MCTSTSVCVKFYRIYTKSLRDRIPKKLRARKHKIPISFIHLQLKINGETIEPKVSSTHDFSRRNSQQFELLNGRLMHLAAS